MDKIDKVAKIAQARKDNTDVPVSGLAVPRHESADNPTLQTGEDHILQDADVHEGLRHIASNAPGSDYASRYIHGAVPSAYGQTRSRRAAFVMGLSGAQYHGEPSQN